MVRRAKKVEFRQRLWSVAASPGHERNVPIPQIVALDTMTVNMNPPLAAFFAALLLMFLPAMYVSWILPLLLRDGSDSNVPDPLLLLLLCG
jgi:hypothetical protein